MYEYLNLLKKILESGIEKSDRTGTGTRSIFGYQMRFDLSTSFPLLTTKKVHFKSIVYELLWFIKGESNINFLNENKVSIWDEWADERGELGPVYGVQWRSWKNHKGETIDQLADVIQKIQTEPNSRRLIVSAWNVGEIPEMALPPCHLLFQFYVADGKLSCQMYQRSADVFLGVPFNIGSYALLTRMAAQVCGLLPGELILTLGDAHLYNNHLKQARQQLSRSPYSPPRLTLNSNIKSIFDFRYEDIQLMDYQSHPRIPAPISV